MANYLPVLLVSVSTNAIPDDSSLSTLPRGQVDYLSHNWEEEDVWRSWRNMTRQKNEIANGMRLENASWRTWWKQRNKLKTVSPETLNWLKDSDVTWLYGPLHTAVDWSPPPRPPPIATEPKLSSAQDRLDLSEPKHKSILKYRSISELLTSDLPSPLFSPAESENEADDRHKSHSKPASDDSAAESSTSASKRPALSYTKSDTHIARWGPDRAFRKDSPPRVGPPEASTSHLSPNQGSNGSSNGGDQSSSNSTSPSPRADHAELGGSFSQAHSSKKKHITFNTFVEQCIAIEKPKPKGKLGALGLGTFEDGDGWNDGPEVDTSYDDGYDEDAEDGFGHDGDWGLDECAVGTDSDSDYNEEIFLQDEGEDEDDGVIEMRSSRKNNSKRSKSKSSDHDSSNTSSGDSYSSSSTSRKSYSTARKSIPPGNRRRRRSDGAHVNLPRRKSSSSGPSSSEKDSHHVTIAPIAPTILKTGNSSWDGFGVHSPYQRGGSGVWMESFGDEGYSDDGGIGSKVLENKRNNDSDGINAPLELVYVPPTGRYGGNGYGSRISSPAIGSPNASASKIDVVDETSKPEKDNDTKDVVEETVENGDKVYHHQQAYFSLDDAQSHSESAASVPIVVKTPPAVDRGGGSDDEAEEDAYDYFGGPDLGGDYSSKRTSLRRKDKVSNSGDPLPGDLSRNSSIVSLDNDGDKERKNRYREDEPRRSRSRSKSRSRTPSPIYVPVSSTPAISVPGRNTSPPQVSTSSSLLSPPSRGSPQLPQSSPRGRSSTRSSPSLLSDRDRSNHGSPLGSLSPEGSTIGIAYGAYANGRGGGDREKESQRGRRDGERGRDRTGRSLSHSLSPDVVGSMPTSPNLSPSRSILLGESNVQSPSRVPSSSAVSTSPSSSSTVVSPQTDVSVEQQQPSSALSSASAIPLPSEVRDEDEIRSTSTPTPANSPVISMSSVAHRIAEMDGKTDSKAPPLNLPGPKLPSASASPSPPIVHTRTASGALQANREKGSTREQGDDGLMGKIMSSAGAYLGLWNNGATAV